MIPIGTLGIFQAFLLYLCPVLGILSVYALAILSLIFLYKTFVKKNSAKQFFTFKIKFFLVFFVVLNSWNIYMINALKISHKSVILSQEYQDQRSRFILPVNYIFDGFTFPKGTLINTYNAHDAGDHYRYLTLTGLTNARFKKPVKIANVWGTALKVDSSHRFLIQLSEDQNIAPVYVLGEQGEMKLDIKHTSITCKKDQIAEFTVPSGYYPETDYTIEDWYTLEDERFEPKLWLFKGCFTAPPIYVERPYPQSKLFDIERMSDVTVSPF